MFDERTRNGFHPRPVGLKKTAGPLLKLQKIAVAVIARPTGALCDERASAPVVAFVCVVSAIRTVQVVRYRPGHHGQMRVSM